MKEMYKGKVNSPATLLVETIDSSVTSIKVADGTVFPEGPNVAVIGTDGNAETIKYESINGNILVGCVRGFQGKSSVWDKDTIIARNFTEYDLDALQENILELDKKQLKDFKEDSTHRTVTDNEKDKWNNPPNPDLSNYVKKEYLANYKLEDGTIQNYNAILDRNRNMENNNSETCIVNMQIDNQNTREYLVKTYKTKYYTAQVAYSLVTPFTIYNRKGTKDFWEDWKELQVAQSFDVYRLFIEKELKKLANKSEVPTKVSQLTNDKNFKTEVEIQSMIEKASSLKKEVVTSLPSTGKEDIIYLLKNKNDTNNYYTEYMWISGKWEIIGNTKVDLTDYAKKSELPKQLKDFQEDENHRTVTDAEKETWNNKVDKISGKSLSTNDYTDSAKQKVDSIPSNPKYTDTTYSNATTSSSGLMSAADKVKLNGLGGSSDLQVETTNSDGITYYKYGRIVIAQVMFSTSELWNIPNNEKIIPSGFKPSNDYNATLQVLSGHNQPLGTVYARFNAYNGKFDIDSMLNNVSGKVYIIGQGVYITD